MRSNRRAWSRRATLAALAVVVAAGAFWLVRRARRPDLPPAVEDPRLTYATPFRNVRPDVGYVGDEACARCHRDHAESYRRHPMARSFFPTAEVADAERYDEPSGNPFEKDGTLFRVERRGRAVLHRATRRGGDGRVLFEAEAEAAYAMGSGARGRSYLVNRDGYLFQSPISWYAQKNIWDRSPGYGSDQLFGRPVPAQCLFCHCNDADPVEHTVNRYREPLFRAHAIGCERCHGPGELHAASRARGDVPDGPVDPTIVNPGHLEPALREAVCQQCHLQGEARVLRRGRQPFDFRPGLPLHLFWAMFVRLPELTDNKAVSHVEQMADSRCFRGSDGKLGCTSCHDPHRLPAPEGRTAFYRGRCLTCHGEPDCDEAPAARAARNKDDCVACHMPRVHSTDIVHTAVTDHRVARRPGADRPAGGPRPLSAGEVPIVHFHRDLVGPDDKESGRDLGLALAELAQKQPRAAVPLARLARPMLEAAAERAPEDVPARAALAEVQAAQGRPREALAACEEALARAPRHEATLATAAALLQGLGKPQEAADYWRRAAEVNPWNSSYHTGLARALADRRDWAAAVEACRTAVRIDPASLQARALLVQYLIGAAERERARAEFDVLAELCPPEAVAELRRWYADLTR